MLDLGNFSSPSLSSLSHLNAIPDLSHAQCGVYLLDLKANQSLYEYNKHKLFIPASLTKLFTTAASLEVLTPSLSLKTSVDIKGSIRDRTLEGSLILRGGGDPYLTVGQLKQLACQVRDRGIEVIEGGVLKDDTFLQGTHCPTHAEWEDLSWHYSSEISALSIEDNAVNLKISPHSKLGHLANVCIEQEVNYCRLLNQLITVDCVPSFWPPIWHKNDSRNFPLQVRRGLTDNHFSISGHIPISEIVQKERLAIHDPAQYACILFMKYLREAGIKITEKEKFCSGQWEEFPDFAYISSQSLELILRRMNKESHNLSAELMIRLIGRTVDHLHPSYLEAGLKEVKRILNKICCQSEHLLYDGAGDSRQNLISPFQVVSLLRFLYNSYGESIVDFLPLAGVDGTLKDRFVGTPLEGRLFAKTGTLSNISNLAGYFLTENGRKIAFCICVNQHLLSSTDCRSHIDRWLLNCVSKVMKLL